MITLAVRFLFLDIGTVGKTAMARLQIATGILALMILLLMPGLSFASGTESLTPLFSAWRWWEETVTWVKSLGMDRHRLVQIWLLFVLIGLYIIVRIKPRA